MYKTKIKVSALNAWFGEKHAVKKNNVKYTQTIELGSMNGLAMYDQPDDNLDAAEYFGINDGNSLYT